MPETTAGSNQWTDEEVTRAIFRIRTQRENGTGFLVEDQWHILTARHVVANSEGRVSVIDMRTGQEYAATIQKTLDEWDVALLRLDIPLTGVQPLLLLQEGLSPQTEVRIFGFPSDVKDRWHLARIAGGVQDTSNYYQIIFRSVYQSHLHGLSGAPVFLENGYDVVGIVYYHDPESLSSGRIVPAEAFPKILDAVKADPISLSDRVPWCYVVLSEADRSSFDLHDAVQGAMTLLRRDPEIQQDRTLLEFGIPFEFEYATDLVASQESYKEAVTKLCRARIAIFDITNNEPVVMMLLGIRSVVKRGVTIASVGGDFVIGKVIDLPFNIKETNIIAHSRKQQRGDVKERTTPYLIRNKVKNGLLQLRNLPQYLDLPTFDAVRNLPPGYREPHDSVLVLCSYSEEYQSNNWEELRNKLQIQLDGKIAADARKGSAEEPGVVRVLDLMSPRLVSQSIYEMIRRVDLCVVDWSEWRPNVFFELGVRLAITDTEGHTVSIIEGKQKKLMQEINKDLARFKNEPDQANEPVSRLASVQASDTAMLELVRNRSILIAPQCLRLLELFHPLVYNCSHVEGQFNEEDLYERHRLEQQVYENIMYYYKYSDSGEVSAGETRRCMPSYTYEVIEQAIDPGGETTSTPVYRELLQTAQLFDVEDTEGRASVLYPRNDALKSSVEEGIKQRLLAAWYFIKAEYEGKEEEIIKDPDLFRDFQLIGAKLSRILRSSRPKEAKDIHLAVQKVRKMHGGKLS